MRRLLGAVVLGTLFAIASLLPQQASAKCESPRLDLQPSPDGPTLNSEVSWGDTAYVHGSCWITWDQNGNVSWQADRVEISARYIAERSDVTPEELAPQLVVTNIEEGAFQAAFDLASVWNLPDPPQPGWIEITGRSGAKDAGADAVLVVDDRRPLGTSHIAGHVESFFINASPHDIVWAPLNDPGSYVYGGIRSDGRYRTAYLEPGQWLVGIVDVEGYSYATDPDVEAVREYWDKYGREVTLYRRVVTVKAGQVTQADFTMERVPMPENASVAADLSQAASAHSDREVTASTTSNGWLAPVLLGAGGLALLGIVGGMQVAGRRRRP